MTTLPPHKQNDKPYTVYALIDPRNYAIRYIGITNDVYSRFMQHLRCDGVNTEKDEWIAELKQVQEMLIMKTLEVVESERKARERETFWIHHHQFLGASLLNQQIPSIKIATQPSVPRPSQIGNPNLGRKYKYDQVKEIFLHRYQKRAWPKDISKKMQSQYEFQYFIKPKITEANNPQKYARHQRSYARGRKWIAEFEAAKRESK